MKIEEFNNLELMVKFFKMNTGMYFTYNNNLYKCTENNLKELKEVLELPYKISFCGLSRSVIGRILGSLKDVNNEILYYRICNSRSNIFLFHAIIFEKEKIKKK